jgi:putative phosphoesterase
VRTAIVSDIHSNHAALQSVLARIDNLNCDRIISTGDVIGYAAHPNEVLDLIRDLSTVTIRGNHDLALLDPVEAESFNEFAREALFWTRSVLTQENLIFLRSLRDQEQIDDIILAHGSLLDPDEYIYSPFQAARSLEIAPCRITVVGHTHYPEVYRFEPSTGLCRDIIVSEGEVKLEEGYRYLINAGSVGQPRDGDWRAGFAVYDTEGSGSVELHRLDYDVHRTMDRIMEVGLPSMLSERLLEGR